MKTEDTVIDHQYREQGSSLAADTPERGKDPETSETPVSAPSDVEDFEGWVRASLLPPLQRDVIAKIAGYEPGDLPEMIEVVRKVELASYAGTRPLIPSKRQQLQIVSDEMERLHKVAYWEAARCSKTNTWLRDLRMVLEGELEDYENEQREGAVLSFRNGQADSPQKRLILETPTRTSGVQESLNEKKDQGELISLASAEQDAYDHVSRAVSETIARINNREPKKWRDLADRVGSLLLTIFLCTMAVGSVCGFLLLWVKVLLTT